MSHYPTTNMNRFFKSIIDRLLAIALAAFLAPNSATALELLHSFKTPPARPYSVIVGSDGDLYGTSNGGGAFGNGTVFKMTPAGVVTILVSFDSNNTGGSPAAGLVQGSDGNFYGTNSSGGGFSYGTVFMVTPAGALTTLVRFDDSTIKGIAPNAALVQGTDGSFYGSTVTGGASGQGTIFKFTTDGTVVGTTFTTLVDFDNNTTKGGGSMPRLCKALTVTSTARPGMVADLDLERSS